MIDLLAYLPIVTRTASPSAKVLVVTGRNIDEETHHAAVNNPESFPD